MTDDNTLWKTLQKYIPRKQWLALTEILVIVQRRTKLDTDDLELAKRSGTPHWKSNVRRVLHSKLRQGWVRARKQKAE
jgi:hypothetical protein